MDSKNLPDTIDKIHDIFETYGDSIPNDVKEKIFDTRSGTVFIRTLYKHLCFLQDFKNKDSFVFVTQQDKRGWLINIPTSLTLSIINKEMAPGNEFYVRSGVSNRGLVVYYGLCPELENFVSLVLWIDTKSSRDTWKAIRELIVDEKTEKNNNRFGLLHLSDNIGLKLPNEIHPFKSEIPQVTMEDTQSKKFDWKYAHYLYDDGSTVTEHVSPVNYRKVFVSQLTREVNYIDIRTTIGHIRTITRNEIEVSIPSLLGQDFNKFVCSVYPTVDKIYLRKDCLLFLQLLRKMDENVRVYLREVSQAISSDLVFNFISQSIYIGYLGLSRLKIMSRENFGLLCSLAIRKVRTFCENSGIENQDSENLDEKVIFTQALSKYCIWIDDYLYYVPQTVINIVRRYLFETNNKLQNPKMSDNNTINSDVINKFNYIITRIDEALLNWKNSCFMKNEFLPGGNRAFKTTKEMVILNRAYLFVLYNLEQKRFLLGFRNDTELHGREELFLRLNRFLK